MLGRVKTGRSPKTPSTHLHRPSACMRVCAHFEGGHVIVLSLEKSTEHNREETLPDEWTRSSFRIGPRGLEKRERGGGRKDGQRKPRAPIGDQISVTADNPNVTASAPSSKQRQITRERPRTHTRETYTPTTEENTTMKMTRGLLCPVVCQLSVLIQEIITSRSPDVLGKVTGTRHSSLVLHCAHRQGHSCHHFHA